MAGMDANLSIKEAKAQQDRTCAGGNDQGSSKKKKESSSHEMNMEHMSKEKDC
jgi:hypothetical protein